MSSPSQNLLIESKGYTCELWTSLVQKVEDQTFYPSDMSILKIKYLILVTLE